MIIDFDENLDSDRALPRKFSALVFGIVFLISALILIPVGIIGWLLLGVKILFNLY